MPIPRIAILGAGPAGLTLASLLNISKIPYTIYESRLSLPPPSTPSGSLDLHTESGLLALEGCGLTSNFKSLTSDCSEDTIIADKNGEVKWADDGMGENRPEVARNDLTSLLLSSLPSASVKWGHKILSVTPSTSSSARWTVHFSSSGREQEADFDLIIGADGAWSKARPLLTDIKPHYSTISCVTLTLPYITERYPELAAMVGKGTYSATGEFKAVMSQRGGLDSARLYLMLHSDSSSYLEDSGLAQLSKSPAEMKKKLIEEPQFFAGWGKGLKDLIAAACDAELEAGAEISAKPLYMLPTSFTWPHVPGITVIGDAAHLMTPFAGEGVNNAMLDAVELSKVIVSACQGEDIDAVLKGFEVEMWRRNQVIAAETWGNLQMFFEENAPDAFVAFMKSHGPPEE